MLEQVLEQEKMLQTNKIINKINIKYSSLRKSLAKSLIELFFDEKIFSFEEVNGTELVFDKVTVEREDNNFKKLRIDFNIKDSCSYKVLVIDIKAISNKMNKLAKDKIKLSKKEENLLYKLNYLIEKIKEDYSSSFLVHILECYSYFLKRSNRVIDTYSTIPGTNVYIKNKTLIKPKYSAYLGLLSFFIHSIVYLPDTKLKNYVDKVVIFDYEQFYFLKAFLEDFFSIGLSIFSTGLSSLDLDDYIDTFKWSFVLNFFADLPYSNYYNVFALAISENYKDNIFSIINKPTNINFDKDIYICKNAYIDYSLGVREKLSIHAYKNFLEIYLPSIVKNKNNTNITVVQNSDTVTVVIEKERKHLEFYENSYNFVDTKNFNENDKTTDRYLSVFTKSGIFGTTGRIGKFSIFTRYSTQLL